MTESKPEVYLFDGFNKSLFKNVLEIYLEKKNINIKDKIKIIDIDNYVKYTNKQSDFHFIAKTVDKKELIDQGAFINEIDEYLDDSNKIIIFNTSRLIQIDKTINYTDDDDPPKEHARIIKMNQTEHILEDLGMNNNSIFLEKENDLFKMNLTLCTLRLHDMNTFTNTFMPFGGYIFFNYLECLFIDKYYEDEAKSPEDKNLKFKEAFKYTIENIFKEKYDEDMMISILNSYLFKKQIKSISFIILIIIFHLLFYLPYYILIISKIKNKKIKIKNKVFLYILLLFPVLLLIVPSWLLLFIPEFINFMALYKLYKMKSDSG